MTGAAEDRSGRSRQAKAPISSHAAFPAIVALWFAALLGLGSLILPVALFEGFSRAANLAAIAPAAAPPLGNTARIVIAILAAIIGGVMGLLIARRVRTLQAVEARHDHDTLAPLLRPVDRHPDAPSKRPILAHAELGSQRFDDPLDADPALSGRDITAEDQPDDGDIELVGIAAEEGVTDDDKTDGHRALDLETFAEPEGSALQPEPTLPDPVQAAAAARDAKPFEQMSLAELVDRFARSLQGRERPEPAGDTTLLRAALPEDRMSSPDIDTEGDRNGGDSDRFEDSGADDHADEDLAVDSDDDGDGDGDAEGGNGGGFSSLLAMRRSRDNGRQTVWSGDEPASDGDVSAEPVVPFPAASPRRRDPAASEQALREALDKLQRMSGAA